LALKVPITASSAHYECVPERTSDLTESLIVVHHVEFDAVQREFQEGAQVCKKASVVILQVFCPYSADRFTQFPAY
jgi:hypothetical protein